jgi:hypothetical protein
VTFKAAGDDGEDFASDHRLRSDLRRQGGQGGFGTICPRHPVSRPIVSTRLILSHFKTKQRQRAHAAGWAVASDNERTPMNPLAIIARALGAAAVKAIVIRIEFLFR